MTLKWKQRNHRAVTLTELLVVLAIISLLATIAVPVYISKLQQARVATTQMEVREISEAMQQVAIVHGFYVPMRVLDNVPNEDNLSNQPSRDDFQKSEIQSTLLIDAFVPVDSQLTQQLTLGSSNLRVRRMIESWQGPFLNPKRVFIQNNTEGETNPIELSPAQIANDYLLDPWGRPYRFFSKMGRIGTQSTPSSRGDVLTLENTDTLPEGIDNGFLTTAEFRFDRFAIVSMGPNGISDTFTGDGSPFLDDDIFYTFSGIAESESTFQPF